MSGAPRRNPLIFIGPTPRAFDSPRVEQLPLLATVIFLAVSNMHSLPNCLFTRSVPLVPCPVTGISDGGASLGIASAIVLLFVWRNARCHYRPDFRAQISILHARNCAASSVTITC